MRSAFVVVSMATAFGVTVAPRAAEACVSPRIDPPTVIPRNGAAGVPTDVMLTGIGGYPTKVVLRQGTTEVPLGDPVLLPYGYDSSVASLGQAWQRRPVTALLPGTEYEIVTTAIGFDGGLGAEQSTRFTTGAAAQDAAVTPAVITNVSLTQVRYPKKDIAAGFCVFSEYVGFLAFTSTPAAQVGTPNDSLMNVVTVTAKAGGASQSVSWIGERAYQGTVPDAAHGYLPDFLWQPALPAGTDHCVTITSYGFDGTSATSAPVCGTVQLVLKEGAEGYDAGAAASGGTNGGTSDAASDGGCSVAAAGTVGRCAVGAMFGVVGLGFVMRRRRRIAATPRSSE